MSGEILKSTKTVILLLILYSLLTGIVYPLLVTGLAQIIFPWQANGSLIEKQGKIIGSQLIGQSFGGSDYFWSRPSATSPYAYNASASTGSNMGPTNPVFLATVKDRSDTLKLSLADANKGVPVELVTASASGLDPDISPYAAYFQIPRIAKSRNISEERLRDLVLNQIISRQLLILGEPRVNVLLLNLALDNLRSDHV